MYYLYGGKFKMFIEKNYDLVSKSVHMVWYELDLICLFNNSVILKYLLKRFGFVCFSFN